MASAAPERLAATSSDKKISSLDLMPFVGRFGSTQDERLKTAVAIQAAPNVIDTLIATILGLFGGYQLITALNALHLLSWSSKTADKPTYGAAQTNTTFKSTSVGLSNLSSSIYAVIRGYMEGAPSRLNRAFCSSLSEL
jgi:hypothetical protein